MWLEIAVFCAIHVCVLRAFQDGLLAPKERLPDNRTKWRRAIFALLASTLALVLLLAILAALAVGSGGRGLSLAFLLLAFPLATVVDGLVFQRVFGVPLRKAMIASSFAVGIADVVTGLTKVFAIFVGGAVIANPVTMGLAAALVAAAFGFTWFRSARQAQRFSTVAGRRGGDDHLAEPDQDDTPEPPDMQAIREDWEAEHGDRGATISRGAVVVLAGAMAASLAVLSLSTGIRLDISPDDYEVERLADNDEFIEMAAGVPHEPGWQPVAVGLEAEWMGRELLLRESGTFVDADQASGLGLIFAIAFAVGVIGVFSSRRRLRGELLRASLVGVAAIIVIWTLQLGGAGGLLWTGHVLLTDGPLALYFPGWFLPLLALVLIPTGAYWGGALAWSLVKLTIRDRECGRCEQNGKWNRHGDCLECGFAGARVGDGRRVLWGVGLLVSAVLLVSVAVLPDMDMTVRCELRPGWDDDVCYSVVRSTARAERDRELASWISLVASDSLAPRIGGRHTFVNRWWYLALGAVAFLFIGFAVARTATRKALPAGMAAIALGWVASSAIAVVLFGGITADPTGEMFGTQFMAAPAWIGPGLAGVMWGYRSRRVIDGV